MFQGAPACKRKVGANANRKDAAQAVVSRMHWPMAATQSQRCCLTLQISGLRYSGVPRNVLAWLRPSSSTCGHVGRKAGRHAVGGQRGGMIYQVHKTNHNPATLRPPLKPAVASLTLLTPVCKGWAERQHIKLWAWQRLR